MVLPSELESEYVDPTLLATRLCSGIRVTTSPTGAVSGVAIGVIAWDDVNDTVPAAADAPGPYRDSDLDWIARQVACIPVGTPAGTQYESADGFSYLSKARRKLGASRGILCTVEASGTSIVVNVSLDVRCLLQQA